MACSIADQDGDGQADVSESCQAIYGASGKCETKMNVDYPNESACTYIEGIKVIREDGVIRTSATRKSTAAVRHDRRWHFCLPSHSYLVFVSLLL
jgi:hypothetical protein